MTSHRGSVYWKDQCGFCENSMLCKYRDEVELLQARLNVVELETTGCYGTISFWCDYYSEDGQKVADAARAECEVRDD